MSVTLEDREALVDRVDENDNPIGTISRSQVFKVHANFRVAHLLIFDRVGRLLIQQLALSRKRHPGQWGSSVAAYVLAGETYEQAMKRRTLEELGLQDLELMHLGKTTMVDEGCLKFISVFSIQHEGLFNIDRSHIASVRFVSFREMIALPQKPGERFTATLAHVLSRLISPRG